MIGKRTLNKCNSLTQDGPVAVPYSLYIFIDGIFFPFFTPDANTSGLMLEADQHPHVS